MSVLAGEANDSPPSRTSSTRMHVRPITLPMMLPGRYGTSIGDPGELITDDGRAGLSHGVVGLEAGLGAIVSGGAARRGGCAEWHGSVSMCEARRGEMTTTTARKKTMQRKKRNNNVLQGWRWGDVDQRWE
jgi:hypothetical protein